MSFTVKLLMPIREHLTQSTHLLNSCWWIHCWLGKGFLPVLRSGRAETHVQPSDHIFSHEKQPCYTATSDAGERRLDERNCEETQHSREKSMGWGWGRIWWKTGRKWVRSKLPKVIMWNAGEMRTLPAGMSRLSRGHGDTREALHIQLGLSVGSQVTKRTCGSMLHLDVCLVPDNYSQEGDGYPMQR